MEPVLRREETGFSDILTDFFGSKYSGHGFTHVANRVTKVRKVLWFIITVICVAFLVKQVMTCFNDYYKYPKKVTIELVEQTDILFPSVTVCNLNIVKLSSLEGTNFESMLKAEQHADEGNCSGYEDRAPWVTNRDYVPFSSDQYWQGYNESDPQSFRTPDKRTPDAFTSPYSTSASTTSVSSSAITTSSSTTASSTTVTSTTTTTTTTKPKDTSTTATSTTRTTTSSNDTSTTATSTTTTPTTTATSTTATSTIAASTTTATTGNETTTTSTISLSSSTLATIANGSNTDTTSVANTTELQTPTETTLPTSSSTTTASPTTQPSNLTTNSYSEASSSENTETASAADTTPEVSTDTETSAITEGPSTTTTATGTRGRNKRQAQATSQSAAKKSEYLTEYGDYVRGSDATNYNQWCRKDDPRDCLETYGSANMDRFDFEGLLVKSKQDDLRDVREAFTPSVPEMKVMGAKPQEFITSCSYDHTACSFRDFYQWQSDTYGNCYTFNSPNFYDNVSGTLVKRPLLLTSKSGYQNGLRLTLDLDTKNYVSLLSPDMGVRVVVHPPSITPIPEEEGFSSPPGFLTSIRIQMKNINRVGQPHGNCHEKNWEKFYRDYSQRSCLLLCLEKKIQEECGCANAINDLIQALNSPLPRCNPTNITQDLCRQLQKKVITDRRLCNCPPACEELIYTPLLSMNQINEKFYRLMKNKKPIYVGQDVCSGSNLSTARLHIYLESLQTEVITESPAMSFNDLLATVGGHVGLFIGFSIVTMVELAELVLDLVLWGGLASGRICKPKSSETSSPVSAIGILQDGVPPPADYKKPPFKQVNDYYDWYEELPPGGTLNCKKFGLKRAQ